jgi:hypothetical protein
MHDFRALDDRQGDTWQAVLGHLSLDDLIERVKVDASNGWLGRIHHFERQQQGDEQQQQEVRERFYHVYLCIPSDDEQAHHRIAGRLPGSG